MFNDDELLPLSGLQHLLFCERQCALIHVERLWVENLFTAEGRIMHERVHDPGRRSSKTIRTEYGVPLRSFELGLTGQADVVEFHRPLGSGTWQPYPVEYKRGKAKNENWDRVQLCAQALCLEEMLKTEVPSGALFYGKTRRRVDVHFDTKLRASTECAAQRYHALVQSGKTPRPSFKPRCEHCSFLDICLPKTMYRKESVKDYLTKALDEL